MAVANDPVALYEDPNRFARPAGIELFTHSARVHGYQEFSITRAEMRPLGIDIQLKEKLRLLRPILSEDVLTRRTVLDIGANAGFFSIWSLRHGARAATALDLDPEYCALMEQLRDHFSIDRLTVARENVTDWAEPADVVIALALVHWIFSCTAVLGTLDAVVGLLRGLTRYVAIIEWVDPADPAVLSFGHTGYNVDHVSGPYDRPTFEHALSTNFARWRRLGDVTETRTLYVAYVDEHEIAWNCPLPAIHPEEAIIACRRLTTHGGLTYWSRVYDGGDTIHKQTTGDLAQREARILARLDDPAFPRVLDSYARDAYSVAVLERVRGVSLLAEADALGADASRFAMFVRDMLAILRRLRQAGVEHRDITMGNVIMRDGAPVLLDFGWATGPEEPTITPAGLGEHGRPDQGSPSDTYATGRLLARIAGGRRPEFKVLLDLMTDPDPRLRIEDADVLAVVADTLGDVAR